MADSKPGHLIRGRLPLDGADADTNGTVLRLCVFMNVLQTLHSHLRAALEEDSASPFDARLERGHSFVTFLLVVGALKEGADALRHFSKRIDVLICELEGTGVDSHEVRAAHARVTAAIDKDDSQSLWNRVLKNVRDDAAFHWRLGPIQRVCETYSGRDCELAIFRDGPPETSMRFPVADEILAEVAFGNNGRESLSDRITEISRLAHDADVVLSTVLPLAFRDHGATSTPIDDRPKQADAQPD